MTSIETIEDVRDDYVVVVTSGNYTCCKLGTILWHKVWPYFPRAKINSTRDTCIISIHNYLVKVDLNTGEELERFEIRDFMYIIEFKDDVVVYNVAEDETFYTYNFASREYGTTNVQEETLILKVRGGAIFTVRNSTILYNPPSVFRDSILIFDEGWYTRLTHVDNIFAIYHSDDESVNALVVNKLTGKYKVVFPPKNHTAFAFSQTHVTVYRRTLESLVTYPIKTVAISPRQMTSLLREVFIREFAHEVISYLWRTYLLDLGFCVV